MVFKRFRVGSLILSLLLVVSGVSVPVIAHAAPEEKMVWDITNTKFCKGDRQKEIALLEELMFFDKALVEDGLKKDSGYAAQAFSGGCDELDSVSSAIAKAFNKIVDNPDKYGGDRAKTGLKSFKSSGSENGARYTAMVKRGSKKECEFKTVDEALEWHKNGQGKCPGESAPDVPKVNKIELPSDFNLNGDEWKNSPFCRSGFKGQVWDKYLVLATSLGDGNGTSLPDKTGEISQEHFIVMASTICNSKDYKAEGMSEQDKEYMLRMARNLKMSVEVNKQYELAEQTFNTLKKSVESGKGTGGIPMEGSVFTQSPIMDVIKDGGVSAKYEVQFDSATGEITVDGKPIEDSILEPLSSHVLSSGNLTVYPGYNNRLELLLKPVNVTRSNYEEFSAALDEKITSYASESFMGYHRGEIDQGDAAVRATVERPDSINLGEWTSSISKLYKESPFRAHFLSGSYAQLNEPDSKVFSVIKGDTPPFFLKKKSAEKWLKENSINSDISSNSWGEWLARFFGFKGEWDGYGMPLAEKISEFSRSKGMVILTSRTDNGLELKRSFEKVMKSTLQNFTIGSLGSHASQFALHKVNRFIGPKSMAISDNIFTGALTLTGEQKALMKEEFKAKKGNIWKAADEAAKGQTKNKFFQWNLRNGYLRAARTSVLAEYNGKGLLGKPGRFFSEKTSTYIANHPKLSTVPILGKSSIMKSEGFKMGKETAQKISAKKFTELGIKQGTLRATQLILGTMGGPFGWVITGVLTAIDVALNFNDYKKLAVQVTRNVAIRFGQDLYPSPTQSEITDANMAVVMYSGFGLVDVGNGAQYVKGSLKNSFWVDQAVTPKIADKIK